MAPVLAAMSRSSDSSFEENKTIGTFFNNRVVLRVTRQKCWLVENVDRLAREQRITELAS